MDSCQLCSLSWSVIYHPESDHPAGTCAYLETINKPLNESVNSINQSSDQSTDHESILPFTHDRWSYMLVEESSLCPYHYQYVNHPSSSNDRSINGSLIIEPLSAFRMNDIIEYNENFFYELHRTISPQTQSANNMFSDSDDQSVNHTLTQSVDPTTEINYELEMLYQCNSQSIFLFEQMYQPGTSQSIHQAINQSIQKSISQLKNQPAFTSLFESLDLPIQPMSNQSITQNHPVVRQTHPAQPTQPAQTAQQIISNTTFPSAANSFSQLTNQPMDQSPTHLTNPALFNDYFNQSTTNNTLSNQYNFQTFNQSLDPFYSPLINQAMNLSNLTYQANSAPYMPNYPAANTTSYQPFTQSFNQLISPDLIPTYDSLNQSISQSMNRSNNPFNCQLFDQSINQINNRFVYETAPLQRGY